MKKWKKILGIFMSGTVLVTGGVLPQKNEAFAADANNYSISGPRIETGMTTWDKVSFGNYYQDFAAQPAEPIKWRVLSVNGDDAFLLADRNLECRPYNDNDEAVTWETSSLREWLNNDFYNEAFRTDAERNAIIKTTVTNNNNAEYETDGGNDTNDNVYLLSIADVMNSDYGFDAAFAKRSKTRSARNTDRAELNGAYSYNTAGDYEGNGYWWLRSPGGDTDYVSYVGYNGYGDDYGFSADYNIYGVRPALHIKLSSSSWTDAGKVDSDGRVTTDSDGINNPVTKDGLTTWDCVYFGTYRQDFCEKQAIEWRVLSVEGDDALLIADKNIDCMPYNDSAEDSKWETSALKNWLNNDFYNEAFTNEEQGAVVEVGDSADKLCLLPMEDAGNAEYGFDTELTADSRTREAMSTDYAKLNGASVSAAAGMEGNGYWWLRPTDNSGNSASYVNYAGGVLSDEIDFDCGVRPIMHLNLSSSLWKKVGEVRVENHIGDSPTAPPESSEEPVLTPTPEPTATAGPTPTAKPDETEKPTVTKEPTPSAKPDETEKPTVTAEPTPSAKPDETEKPTVTKEPTPSAKPDETEKPTVTAEPTPSAKPDETEKPTVTKEPTPSAKPGETEKPAVTKEPGADSDLSGKEFTYGNLRYVVSGKTAVVTGAVKKNVTKVNIPASVKWNKTSFKVSKVSDRAFKNYKKLKNVIIGKNVSTLGKESFSGCSKLTKVTVNSKVLNKIGKSAFNKTAKNMKLYVPKSRYVKYTKKVFKGKGLAGSVKYYKRKG